MKEKELSFKDLNKKQLEALKGMYIDSVLASMSKSDLEKFVRSILTDQVEGTVGNEEEKEAWKEMKGHFQDQFEERIQDAMKIKGSDTINIKNEKNEHEKRLETLEQRKTEKEVTNDDMW